MTIQYERMSNVYTSKHLHVLVVSINSRGFVFSSINNFGL